jgi:DNA polymerase-3 subunit beta
MKTTTTKQELTSGLSFLSGIPAKSTLQILQNVLIKQDKGVMSFLASSVEVQATSNVLTESTDTYAFTVDYDRLNKVVGSISDDAKVTLDIEDGKISLKAGRSKFSIQTLPVEDFPLMEMTEPKGMVTIKQEELKRLIVSVSKAMGVKDTRYFLNGAFFEVKNNVLNIVGTNGSTLSINSMPLECADITAIIPAATVFRMIKTLSTGDMVIEFFDKKIRMMINGNEIIANLIDGKYPDYMRVIPQSYPNEISVDKSRFIESCKRAAVSANDKYRAMRVTFGKQLKFECASGIEASSDDFDIDYSGVDIDAGFNCDYLINAADSVASDKLTIQFKDSTSSILVCDGEFKCVVMPLRM